MRKNLGAGKGLPPSYHCCPEVAWAVEDAGTLLLQCDTGSQRFLGYPEAALWDLLSRGIPMRRIIGIVSGVTGMEAEAARTWVLRTLDSLTHERWLKESGRDG